MPLWAMYPRGSQGAGHRGDRRVKWLASWRCSQYAGGDPGMGSVRPFRSVWGMDWPPRRPNFEANRHDGGMTSPAAAHQVRGEETLATQVRESGRRLPEKPAPAFFHGASRPQKARNGGRGGTSKAKNRPEEPTPPRDPKVSPVICRAQRSVSRTRYRGRLLGSGGPRDGYGGATGPSVHGASGRRMRRGVRFPCQTAAQCETLGFDGRRRGEPFRWPQPAGLPQSRRCPSLRGPRPASAACGGGRRGSGEGFRERRFFRRG